MDAKFSESQDGSKRGFDNKKLAILVKNEVGDRTHSVFCEERKVSRTTLHMIIHEKLEAPPSATTLAKIAGPNELLRNELLQVCDYSLSDYFHAKTNAARKASLKQLILPEPENHAVRGLMLVLSFFHKTGKYSEFRWEYPDEDKFSLKSDRHEVIIIPAFCSKESEINSVHQNVSKKLLKMICTLNGSDDEKRRRKYYLIITNSDRAYDKLHTTSSLLTELPCRISVALCTDGKKVNKQEEVFSDGAGCRKQNQEPFPVCLIDY